MHYMEDDSVEKYSRDTKHNTQMFPDVVLAVLRLKKPSLRSFALDCEVVACEREKQQIFHFQKPLSVMSVTARLLSACMLLTLCMYAFDTLYRIGQRLFQQQLKAHRKQT